MARGSRIRQPDDERKLAIRCATVSTAKSECGQTVKVERSR